MLMLVTLYWRAVFGSESYKWVGVVPVVATGIGSKKCFYNWRERVWLRHGDIMVWIGLQCYDLFLFSSKLALLTGVHTSHRWCMNNV